MPGSGGVLDQLAKAIEDHSGFAREAKDEALKFVGKVKPLVKAGRSYLLTQILLFGYEMTFLVLCTFKKPASSYIFSSAVLIVFT